MAEPTDGCGKIGFVQRELNGISAALQGPQPPKRQAELYAAQQALCWALDPNNFASPLKVLTNTQEG